MSENGKGDHQGEAAECKIIRDPTDNYRYCCKDGYRHSIGRWHLWQAHHILPISALKVHHIRAKRSENAEYIEKCLCITVWDINDELNLLGLDTKWPYYYDASVGVPLPDNLPSHCIDHTRYCHESWDYMEAAVWDTLKDNREIHKLDPQSIEKELDDAVKYFKDELNYRGRRVYGTLKCWELRFDPTMEDKWYIPFSMCDDPPKRHPGVPTDCWKNLETVFASIS